MVAILFRTIVIYLLLMICMRLMGKRQIGELELSELVTTLLLSEIASLPITNHEIPVLFAVIPIITLLSLEVFASMLLIKFPAFKRILTPSPNVIIERGILRQRELRRLRISNEEFLCELRREGITDINEVYYAVIEENGKLSVIQRSGCRQPTASQLGLTVKETGANHILISDGKLDRHGLQLLKLSENDLDLYLNSRRCRMEEVFLLLCNDAGDYTLILKERDR